MRINLAWYAPLMLKSGKSELGYYCELEQVPNGPGIYIFARKFGSTYEYLYVGETLTMQSRIKNHLNNLQLMKNLQAAKNGQRYLIYADLSHHKSVSTKVALQITERAIIEFALIQQHALLNKQGTARRVHTIASEFPPGHKTSLGLPSVASIEDRRK